MPENIDGFDQWEVLNQPPDHRIVSPRKEILHNIDPVDGYVSYLRADGWKYVNGTTQGNKYGGWYGAERVVHLEPKEYVTKVRTSLTWKALEKYALKNLTEQEIMDLRSVSFCDNKSAESSCDPLKGPCLFNVFEDACERNNLAAEEREILSELQDAVEQWKLKAVPINNKPKDPKADPLLHNGVWTPWLDI